MTTNPVWLNVSYAEPYDYHVLLHISANNDPRLAISVIHESIVGPEQYDLAGNGAIDLVVQDSETLQLIVRDHCSKIVAHELYRVNTDLTGQLSAVLVPFSGLIVDQVPQKLIDRIASRAIDEACPVSTDELEVAEVAR